MGITLTETVNGSHGRTELTDATSPVISVGQLVDFVKWNNATNLIVERKYKLQGYTCGKVIIHVITQRLVEFLNKPSTVNRL